MPADIRRASILERIQRDGGASVAELARDYGVSPITVHRDLERLARDGLIERVHGGARPARQRSQGAPRADRLDEAAQAGLAGEAGDRGARGRFRRGRLDDLRRLVHDLPRARPPSGASSAARAHPRHELPGDRRRASRPVHPRRRHSRRGRPDAPHDRRPVGGRVPRRAQHGDRLRLGRRRHARERADNDAAGSRRHPQRRIGFLDEDDRPHRLVQVRASPRCLRSRGRRSSTPWWSTMVSLARRSTRSRRPASTSSWPTAKRPLLPLPPKEDPNGTSRHALHRPVGRSTAGGARRQGLRLGLRRTRARLLGRSLRRRRGACRPGLRGRPPRDPGPPRPPVRCDLDASRRPGRL